MNRREVLEWRRDSSYFFILHSGLLCVGELFNLEYHLCRDNTTLLPSHQSSKTSELFQNMLLPLL